MSMFVINSVAFAYVVSITPSPSCISFVRRRMQTLGSSFLGFSILLKPIFSSWYYSSTFPTMDENTSSHSHSIRCEKDRHLALNCNTSIHYLLLYQRNVHTCRKNQKTIIDPSKMKFNRDRFDFFVHLLVDRYSCVSPHNFRVMESKPFHLWSTER